MSLGEILFYPPTVAKYEIDEALRYTEHLARELSRASWILFAADSHDTYRFHYHVIRHGIKSRLVCTRTCVQVGSSLYQLAGATGSDAETLIVCRQIAVLRVGTETHSHDRFWRSRLAACAMQMGLYNRELLNFLIPKCEKTGASGPDHGSFRQPGLQILWEPTPRAGNRTGDGGKGQDTRLVALAFGNQGFMCPPFHRCDGVAFYQVSYPEYCLDYSLDYRLERFDQESQGVMKKASGLSLSNR